MGAISKGRSFVCTPTDREGARVRGCLGIARGYRHFSFSFFLTLSPCTSFSLLVEKDVQTQPRGKMMFGRGKVSGYLRETKHGSEKEWCVVERRRFFSPAYGIYLVWACLAVAKSGGDVSRKRAEGEKGGGRGGQGTTRKKE